MKKGIVMEMHQKYTIIMTEEGNFQKTIPINDSAVGTEVIYEPLTTKSRVSFFFHPKKKRQATLRILAMACIVLLFIFPFYFLAGNEETYAYVNVEINPSIELEIDEALHVQAIQPLNKDASRIVDELTGYQNKSIEKVIEMIMNESEETGLINNGKNMLVGVSYVAEDKVKKPSVIDRLKSYFKQEESSWEIAAFKVPKDIREKAKKSNKSMNEVMATTIIETDSDTKTIGNKINENDKAIINSFYNTKSKKPNEKNKEKDNKNKPAKTKQDSLKIEEKPSPNHDSKKKDDIRSTQDQKKARKPNTKHKGNEHKGNIQKQDKKITTQDNGNHYGEKKGKNAKDLERQKNDNGKHKGNKNKHNNHSNHVKDKHNKHNNHGKNKDKNNNNNPGNHNKDKHSNHKSNKHNN